MLSFVYGPMNSGKTTLLLQTVFSNQSRGFSVILLKPKTDTRDNVIKSRMGVEKPIDIVVDEKDNIPHLIKNYIKNNPEAKFSLILVDEAQFLTLKQAEELYIYSLKSNLPVIAYGLKTDFQTRVFPTARRLLELSDACEELDTVLCRCGAKAKFNARFNNDTGEIITEGTSTLIEGSDSNIVYDPVCGKCFIKYGGNVFLGE